MDSSTGTEGDGTDGELSHSRSRLRALASQLTLVEQRERQRIAAELHDYLAQLLALGRMKLGQAKRDEMTPRSRELNRGVG